LPAAHSLSVLTPTVCVCVWGSADCRDAASRLNGSKGETAVMECHVLF